MGCVPWGSTSVLTPLLHPSWHRRCLRSALVTSSPARGPAEPRPPTHRLLQELLNMVRAGWGQGPHGQPGLSQAHGNELSALGDHADCGPWPRVTCVLTLCQGQVMGEDSKLHGVQKLLLVSSPR